MKRCMKCYVTSVNGRTGERKEFVGCFCRECYDSGERDNDDKAKIEADLERIKALKRGVTAVNKAKNELLRKRKTNDKLKH